MNFTDTHLFLVIGKWGMLPIHNSSTKVIPYSYKDFQMQKRQTVKQALLII